ncbi:MAG: hypothetical protein HY722_04360 [Planctomycetes bacterium]|nr:hypothetical protein [Planctomycetota bacterium]
MAAAGPAAAQTAPPWAQGDAPPVQFTGRGKASIGRTRAVLTDDVAVRQGDLELLADGVVIWLAEVEGRRTARALYAEGLVQLSLGGGAFVGDRALVDIEAGRATLLDGRLVAAGGGAAGVDKPLHVTAARIEVRFHPERGEGGATRYVLDEAVATEASATTCEFGEPHYAFQAGRLRLVQGPEGRDLSVEDAALAVGGLPPVPLPGLGADVDLLRRFPRLRAGRSSKFGRFVRSRWELLDLRGLDLRGDADYLETRGTGYGLEPRWRGEAWGEPYHGRVESWWIKDRNPDRVEFEDRNRRRGRSRAWHRQELPGGWFLSGDFAQARDQGFLPEYFKDEVRTEKRLDTDVHLAGAWDNRALMGTALFRRQRWDDLTERIPRVRAAWVSEPVAEVPLAGRELQLSSDWSVEQLRRAFNKRNPTLPPDRREWRFDAVERAELPLGGRKLRVSPFLEGRFTAFQETERNDDSIERTALSTGVRADTRFWRVLGVRSGPFAFDSLRHLVSPSVGWTEVFREQVPSSILIPVDEVDTVSRLQVVEASLRNRLQARQGDAVREFLDWEVDVRHFPEPHRDQKGRAWSNLESDLRWWPLATVSGWSRAEFSTRRARFETAGVGGAMATGGLTLGLSNSYSEGAYSTTGASVQGALGTRWSAEATASYDFRDDEFRQQGVLLQRRFHRWFLHLEFGHDVGARTSEASFQLGLVDLLSERERSKLRIR